MLTVRNMRSVPEPTPSQWARENRVLLSGVILWAGAMTCIAWLGQPSNGAADDWYHVSNVESGLL